MNKCEHENVVIEEPCCKTVGSSGYIECDCGGETTVYCYDCRNEQLTDDDVEEILCQ